MFRAWCGKLHIFSRVEADAVNLYEHSRRAGTCEDFLIYDGSN